MKDYMCVMMTARGCGHCSKMRGNGVMGGGSHFMKPSVIDEFINISNNYTLFNIHYDNMSGKRDLIREISKFSKQNDNIIQEMWSIDGENTRFLKIEANTKTKKIIQNGIDVIKHGDKNILWSEFIKSKVPEKIDNYTYYYPCFMITRTDNWLNSLNNNSQLYALTNAGKTRKNKSGEVFLDKDGKSFNERMVDPKDMIRDVTTGKVKISPHIDDTLDTKVESNTEKKPSIINKRKENRKKSQNKNNKVIIRQY